MNYLSSSIILAFALAIIGSSCCHHQRVRAATPQTGDVDVDEGLFENETPITIRHKTIVRHHGRVSDNGDDDYDDYVRGRPMVNRPLSGSVSEYASEGVDGTVNYVVKQDAILKENCSTVTSDKVEEIVDKCDLGKMSLKYDIGCCDKIKTLFNSTSDDVCQCILISKIRAEILIAKYACNTSLLIFQPQTCGIDVRAHLDNLLSSLPVPLPLIGNRLRTFKKKGKHLRPIPLQGLPDVTPTDKQPSKGLLGLGGVN